MQVITLYHFKNLTIERKKQLGLKNKSLLYVKIIIHQSIKAIKYICNTVSECGISDSVKYALSSHSLSKLINCLMHFEFYTTYIYNILYIVMFLYNVFNCAILFYVNFLQWRLN